jgi:hypothetical protein
MEVNVEIHQNMGLPQPQGLLHVLSCLRIRCIQRLVAYPYWLL